MEIARDEIEHNSDYKVVELSCIERRGDYRLRVFIYREPGISIKDCENVAMLINERMEKEGIENDYMLEVSSPGADRKLKSIEEYDIFKGKEVKLKLRREYMNSHNLRGIIEGSSNEKVKIKVNGKTLSIPYDNIKSARLVFEYDIKDIGDSV